MAFILTTPRWARAFPQRRRKSIPATVEACSERETVLKHVSLKAGITAGEQREEAGGILSSARPRACSPVSANVASALVMAMNFRAKIFPGPRVFFTAHGLARVPRFPGKKELRQQVLQAFRLPPSIASTPLPTIVHLWSKLPHRGKDPVCRSSYEKHGSKDPPLQLTRAWTWSGSRASGRRPTW